MFEAALSMNAPAPLIARMALVLCLLSMLLLCLGLMAGSQGLEWPIQWQDSIVQEIRLPRTLGAWLAGALLGLAGALAQGLFRNPLADPYLLGSASGATLGVTIALMLGLWGGLQWSAEASMAAQWAWRLGLTGCAFVGAWLAVLLTLLLAKGVQHTLRLLLAGVVVGVVLGAITSLMLVLRPQIYPAMQSFTLGSTAMLSGASCTLMAWSLLMCVLLAWRLSPLLDGLSLGEATAQSLGLRVAPLRFILLAVMALATATAVAQTGLIAFVGLVAPHLVRARVRTTFAPSALLAALMGGVLLCGADILARLLLAPQELPVGVLTGVLGGGYLLWRLQSPTKPAEAA
jgi:iron complex transport system permease protein